MKLTVATATWQRHDLILERCIPSVAAQTVPVEHLIVSDGPDPVLREKLADLPVRFVELPEHREPGTCGWAYNHATAVAEGEYVFACDDDNALRPGHCELLSAALDANPGAAFGYSRVFRHGCGDVIGSDPPFYGGIDGSGLVWRRDTLDRYGPWPTDGQRSEDWRTVSGWLANGATYVHVPQVTVDYYFWPGSASWRIAQERGWLA